MKEIFVDYILQYFEVLRSNGYFVQLSILRGILLIKKDCNRQINIYAYKYILV
jgi:hypothetical protein